jgi:acyl carrier protein
MSEDTALESRLKGYIESVRGNELKIDVGDLPKKHLINDLGMDSLDIMNFLFQIEENEKVQISEADMESLALFKFGNLAAFVRKQLAG